MAIRTFSCPACKLSQTRETGPLIGPVEIVCANCGNTLKVYDHGAGDFTFEIWTGRTEKNGMKSWTLSLGEKKQATRVL